MAYSLQTYMSYLNLEKKKHLKTAQCIYYSEYAILLIILSIVTDTYKNVCNVTFSTITTNTAILYV